MRRFIRFFKKTSVKVVGFVLAALLVVSAIVFKDFYIAQAKKAVSFYHVYEGDKYYKKNVRQKAIESYKKALKLYPKHYKAQYNLANIYVAYEDFYSAVDSYEKTLAIKPNFQIARIDYGIILSEAMFNYDKAIAEYTKAIELAPRFLYIPFIVNNKYTSNHNKGIAYYNMGIAWRGKSLLAGENSFDSRRYLENAVKAYRESLKVNKSYSGYYNLAIAHHLLKQNANAGINYCNAIEKEPMNYEAHYNLAILLKDMKNYKDSIDEFKKAGLILDVKGEGVKTRYIYDVLNEASKSLVQNGEYKYLVEHLDGESQESGDLTYVNGKVIIAEELDKAMISNFKNCKSKAFFKNIQNNDALSGELGGNL